MFPSRAAIHVTCVDAGVVCQLRLVVASVSSALFATMPRVVPYMNVFVSWLVAAWDLGSGIWDLGGDSYPTQLFLFIE